MIVTRWQKDTPNNANENVVFEILNELIDRSGFEEWWGDIDEVTQSEILDSLVEIVKGSTPQ